MLAALKPHSSTGPPMAPYKSGEITPSVVFSATVSTVALMTSSSLRFCVSRPTMRATCFRPAATPEASAFSTPRASRAMDVTAMPSQSITAMPISPGQRPHRLSRPSSAAVTAMVSSTVDAVSTTALLRRLPPRLRSRFSMKAMYRPMAHTG